MATLSLDLGMSVLDFGAGPGYFSLPMARLVGPLGWVLATDVEPGMLSALKGRVGQAGLTNVWPAQCAGRALPLQDGAVDRVLLSLVLHEVKDWVGLLKETRRVLRPGGLLVLVEWQPGRTEHGPTPEERLSPVLIDQELDKAGFRAGNRRLLGSDCYVQVAAR